MPQNLRQTRSGPVVRPEEDILSQGEADVGTSIAVGTSRHFKAHRLRYPTVAGHQKAIDDGSDTEPYSSP